MLAKLQEIIQKSEGAVGAFNTFNLEITQGIVRGARQAALPVIIQTTENAVKYAGLEALFFLIKSTIGHESGSVPIAIHLDHGKNLEIVREALALGYSSVHLDASEHPFEENIRLTREAVELGHAQGAWVQGELGNIYGREGLIKLQQGAGMEELFTRPDQVREFVDRTGVDTIAVAIGSLHGHFVGKENLDFERLAAIRKEVGVPIVLHGGSGISDEQVRQAIEGGVKIVNVDTDLRLAFAERLRETLKLERDLVDPRELLKPSVDAVSEAVSRKARLFNSI